LQDEVPRTQLPSILVAWIRHGAQDPGRRPWPRRFALTGRLGRPLQ